MIEIGAALCAGLGVTAAILAVALPAPEPAEDAAVRSWLRRHVGDVWASPARRRWLMLQVGLALAGGIGAILVTGLPALAVPGATGAAAAARGVAARRARARQVVRQDAVLDSVRMLRQLLETGATSVHSALAVLGERGPAPLRSEFRAIAATSVGRRQAWTAARRRVGEPLFDMLAAAVLVQSPGGGELAPLFADLEASVSGAQEVEREARALQVQARSAAAIIVSLPVVFLVVLSALRSPYLDVYHSPAGQAFLLAMLAIMAGSYLWMRRLLLLPGLQRVRLADA
jgi:Flp pilus assembly protein TadB